MARTGWSRARCCSWYARAFAHVVRALVMTGCVASGTAHAQVERGEIRLVVTDQTGLAIGASGTLASEAPQLRRQFSIDESGRFTLGDLPFGVFRLIVERSGFTPYSDLVE